MVTLHSIVSGTYKPLKLLFFPSAYNELTVRSTAKHFRLRAIDGDRCRKASRQSRSLQILLQPHVVQRLV